MTLFRVLLIVMGVVLFVYTIAAVVNEGPNLFANTIPAVAEFGWQGQFHLDFATYLILSGLWVAWRHRFSAAGIVMGLIAANIGIIFLSAYILLASFKANGDMRRILLGDRTSDAI